MNNISSNESSITISSSNEILKSDFNVTTSGKNIKVLIQINDNNKFFNESISLVNFINNIKDKDNYLEIVDELQKKEKNLLEEKTIIFNKLFEDFNNKLTQELKDLNIKMANLKIN